ncbi:AAA family ATPase [Rhodovulum steppense]|uniref:Primase-like protein n=1 Tax=Rhodovulum steppense TaxID=540251 RepID=A0A4R1YVM0_9RHOB|nr:AAA family ATPase [Rhodovulum steppense]TCM85179.1 primase-like protein [Rhodovulum steppense]
MTYMNQLDLADLLGPPRAEKENAAPAGPRNGAKIDGNIDTTEHSTSPDSSLDLPLSLTFFCSKTDTTPQNETLTLRQFVERAGSVFADEKAELPLVKLGTFKGGRKAEHLTARHGVEIDYDAGEVTPNEAAARLRAAGLAAVVFTSSSHTPDKPRWRVLLPTAAPVSPAASAVLVERVNGALGGIAGKESFDPSRCYFFGRVRGNAPPEIHMIDGRTIDHATDLPRIGKRAAPIDDLAELLGPDTPAPIATEQRPLSLTAAQVRDLIEHLPNPNDADRWHRKETVTLALKHQFSGDAEGLEILHSWARKIGPDYDAKEVAKEWQRRKVTPPNGRAAITLASLVAEAKAHGWSWPEMEISDSDFEDLPELPRAKSRLSFLSPSECEAAPSRGYVLKGFLAPGDVGCIVGAPGAGKSLLSPFLGYAVAQGREVFGMRARAGGVFYVAAEDPHGMRGRVKALKSIYGDAPEFQLVAGVSDLLAKESPDLVALLEAVKAQRPALIFLDTLAMAFPGLEENSAEGMGRVVSVARKLTRWGAAVLLIHHDTKDGQQGLPRGHSLLNGALDVALHIKRDESGVVRGRLTKNRNGPCDRDIAFTIGTIAGGTDEDGDEIRLPYAAPCSAAASYAFEKLPRSEQAALDVLEREGGRLPEADYKDVMASGRDVSASDNAKSRRDVATRAIRGLLEKGRIKFKDGFYCIPDDFDDLDTEFVADATARHDATEARQVAIVATRQTDAPARPTRQQPFRAVALSRRVDALSSVEIEGMVS